MIMGMPPSSANCFEGAGWPRLAAAADMRVPSPAAGMMTETFINREKEYSSRAAAYSPVRSAVTGCGWRCTGSGERAGSGGAGRLAALSCRSSNLPKISLPGDGGHFVDGLQHVAPPAPATALERIGGVGDQLQLAQHKLRQHQDAVEESRRRDIRDAPVNDDAGVEDFVNLLALLFAAEDA